MTGADTGTGTGIQIVTKHDDGGLASEKSLWDEYAGQSLTGYRGLHGTAGTPSDQVAGLASFDADAMIVEKRKREQK